MFQRSFGVLSATFLVPFGADSWLWGTGVWVARATFGLEIEILFRQRIPALCGAVCPKNDIYTGDDAHELFHGFSAGASPWHEQDGWLDAWALYDRVLILFIHAVTSPLHSFEITPDQHVCSTGCVHACTHAHACSCAWTLSPIPQ